MVVAPVRSASRFENSFSNFARIVCTVLIVLCTVAVSNFAKADILFEGYSKVLLDGKHVGYVVQRYEFDNKKQEFKTAYYLKTSPAGGNITESLKARATSSFHPISYQFTELVGEHVKTIDAEFKGDSMTANINDGGRKEVVAKKIPKSAFLSSFLAYVMLQGKEGLKKGVKYSYQAIAEEDATLSSGEAFITGEEQVDNMSAFKILNTFKGSQFISYCTYKGEVIATRSPVQKISTELVATVREATEGLSLNSSALTQLFGNVPRGADNPLARRHGAAEPSVPSKTDSTELVTPTTVPAKSSAGKTGTTELETPPAKQTEPAAPGK